MRHTAMLVGAGLALFTAACDGEERNFGEDPGLGVVGAASSTATGYGGDSGSLASGQGAAGTGGSSSETSTGGIGGGDTSSGAASGGAADTTACEVGSVERCWAQADGTALAELGGEPLGDCRYGSRTCSEEGTWGPCEGAVGPAASDDCSVAGADSDCNGVPNEGCECSDGETRSCGTDVGNCELGMQTCSGSSWGPCEGGVSAQANDSCATSGDDANCNGTPNDGCSCTAGESEPCAECGTRTCLNTGTWGDCTGDSRTEACWEDEDGNALAGDLPEEELGNCRIGERRCESDGLWSVCAGAVAPADADSCDIAGDDANCNGTANEGCNCIANEMRACGSDVGNCQSGMQTCGTNLTWGSCVGEVAAQATDSCSTNGDDANCNGQPNEGCECTEDRPSTCNDNVACTDDLCQGGSCQNPVSSGSCRIGGVCYSSGAANPNNPCQYCEPGSNQTSWTNRPNGTSCDDGLWCTGTDTCNSSGQCGHQYSGNGRCSSLSGPCKSNTCSEDSQCFASTSVVCESGEERECSSPNACGAVARSRGVTRYCSGNSLSCTGSTVTDPTWNSVQCESHEVCDGSTNTCRGDIGCVEYCDDDNNRCWTRLFTDYLGGAAESLCDNLNWGGRTNWRLPTLTDLTTLVRGCQDGTATGDISEGYCYASCGNAAQCSLSNLQSCSQCTDYDGPGQSGCYWHPDLVGSCGNGIWSSTFEYEDPENPGAGWAWVYYPYRGSFFYDSPTDIPHDVRCVVDN